MIKTILTGAQNETPAQAQKTQDPMGQLFPLMALGGMSDKFLSSYLVMNMLGGQNSMMPGTMGGMNPLFLGPMFGMDMGLFWMRFRLCIHVLKLSLSLIATIIDDAIIFIIAIFRAIFIRTLYLLLCVLCDCVTCIIPLILWFTRLNKSIRN